MTKHPGITLAFICSVITLTFWLTSMVTPGWIHITKYETYQNFTKDEGMSIFYIKVCAEDQCIHLSYEQIYKERFGSYILGMLDVQIESATALILCAISCIILIIPIKPTSIKMLAVVILTSIAATVECILVLQFLIANARIAFAEHNDMWLNFPYSIVLSTLGIVFAIINCFVSVVVYHNSREEDFQRKRFHNRLCKATYLVYL